MKLNKAKFVGKLALRDIREDKKISAIVVLMLSFSFLNLVFFPQLHLHRRHNRRTDRPRSDRSRRRQTSERRCTGPENFKAPERPRSRKNN